MNERIRELLVKARKSTKEGKWNAPTAVWAEKFAELIVRECISMADDFECVVNQRGLVDRMKQHFGVEE